MVMLPLGDHKYKNALWNMFAIISRNNNHYSFRNKCFVRFPGCWLKIKDGEHTCVRRNSEAFQPVTSLTHGDVDKVLLQFGSLRDHRAPLNWIVARGDPSVEGPPDRTTDSFKVQAVRAQWTWLSHVAGIGLPVYYCQSVTKRLPAAARSICNVDTLYEWRPREVRAVKNCRGRPCRRSEGEVRYGDRYTASTAGNKSESQLKRHI